jgi:hypothetical protein
MLPLRADVKLLKMDFAGSGIIASNAANEKAEPSRIDRGFMAATWF